jgi:hypothetical protein
MSRVEVLEYDLCAAWIQDFHCTPRLGGELSKSLISINCVIACTKVLKAESLVGQQRSCMTLHKHAVYEAKISKACAALLNAEFFEIISPILPLL